MGNLALAKPKVSEKQREFLFTLADFDVLRNISNQHTGITVSDDKFDMFYGRLSKRVRTLGLSDFHEYCRYLQEQPDEEFTPFINAITTNLTSFFREGHHFDLLAKEVIPELLDKNAASRRLRIWSAGCSTGEEPYSLAMTVLENVPGHWNVKILATDLDTNVLNTAASGIYTQLGINDIPRARLKRFFKRGKGRQHDKVKVNQEVRQLIQFRQLNLMTEWPMKGQFDFIFCRNVLIYFDNATKTKLAGRYSEQLRENGWLFIGNSESLHTLDTPFNLVGKTVYQK